MTPVKWKYAGIKERTAVVELCGWCNKKGNATPMGKRIAMIKSSDLTSAAARVLKNHGIIID